MIAYGYDDNFIYTGEVERQKNPLVPGEWLMPARATEKIPPAIPDGHQARFLDDEWIIELIPEKQNEDILE